MHIAKPYTFDSVNKTEKEEQGQSVPPCLWVCFTLKTTNCITVVVPTIILRHQTL